MYTYTDRVMVVKAKKDDNGNDIPDFGNAAACTVASTWTKGANLYYLVRVRAKNDTDFPADLDLPDDSGSPGKSGGKGNSQSGNNANPAATYHSSQDFKTNRPDLWTHFKMNPHTFKDTETGQNVTVTPQIPVFL